MKNLCRTSIFLFGLGLTSFVYAQSVSIELEQACLGDVDLTDFTVALATGTDAVGSESFSSDEAAQITAVLSEDATVNLDTRGKLAAVLQACSEGRILQIRNSNIINTP